MQAEYGQHESSTARTHRWANAILIATAFFAIALGLVIKNQAITATASYSDLAAGIIAQYPDGWLLDDSGDYVFRVQDPRSGEFLTTLQVAIEPIGADASARIITDRLTLSRARSLAAYSTLHSEPYVLPDGETATWLDYVYVHTEENPFVQNVPSVVRGVDVITLKRGQAIIVTFRVEKDRFDDEFWRLEQFLASLEF